MSESSRTVPNPWVSRAVHATLVVSLLVVIGFQVHRYFYSASEVRPRSGPEDQQNKNVRDWFITAGRAFAREQWEAAVEALEKVVEQDPENLPAWVRLAYAHHMLGHYDPALAAYLRVIQFEGRPRAWALYNIAAVYALKDEKRMALDYLREAVEAGFRQRDGEPPVAEDRDFRSFADDPEFLSLAELTKPVSKRDVYHQLDLMIGKWNLAGTANNRIGFAEFTSASGGCAIVGKCVDNSRSTNSTILLYYDPTNLKWRLVWLDDQGNVTHLEGGTGKGESLVLDGEQVTADGRRSVARTILEELDDGSFHIALMTSADGGDRWTDVLDARLLPQETKRARSAGPALPAPE